MRVNVNCHAIAFINRSWNTFDSTCCPAELRSEQRESVDGVCFQKGLRSRVQKVPKGYNQKSRALSAGNIRISHTTLLPFTSYLFSQLFPSSLVDTRKKEKRTMGERITSLRDAGLSFVSFCILLAPLLLLKDINPILTCIVMLNTIF